MESNKSLNFLLQVVLLLQTVRTQHGLMDALNAPQDSLILKKKIGLDMTLV